MLGMDGKTIIATRDIKQGEAVWFLLTPIERVSWWVRCVWKVKGWIRRKSGK
jgi:hypothetical protein